MFAASRLSRPLTQNVFKVARFGFSSTSGTSNLVINAVGQDRVGIVSDITGLVIDVGGNVGESQAAKLGSHFSLMMLVSIPSAHLDDLKASLNDVPGMNAAVFEATGGENKITPQIAYSGYFSLEGADNPGIVHKITSALAKHGLSIDKMEAEEEIAPNGGAMLFKMRGVASALAPLSNSFDISKIKGELEDLGDSLNCEVTLEDVVDDKNSASFYGG